MIDNHNAAPRAYTREDWHQDRTFSAAPGQEVEEEIYAYFLDCMPPLRLPRCRETQGFSAGFLMGEPHSTDPQTGQTLFLAFARAAGRHYYVGLLPARPQE